MTTRQRVECFAQKSLVVWRGKARRTEPGKTRFKCSKLLIFFKTLSTTVLPTTTLPSPYKGTYIFWKKFLVWEFITVAQEIPFFFSLCRLNYA